MLTPEIVLGIGTVAVLLLSGLIMLRDAQRTESGPLAGLLSWSVATYAALVIPVPHAVIWAGPLEVISTGTPALIWIWTGRVFDDSFEPSWRDVIAWIISPLLRAIAFFYWIPAMGWAMEGLSLLFTALAIWRALAGLRGDLVERRRRVRPIIAALAILFSAKIIIGDLLRHGAPATGGERLTNAIMLAALAVAFAVIGLRARRPFTGPEPAEETDAPMPASIPMPTPPADDHEAALLARLTQAMETDKAYRQDAFGLPSLAALLDVPEYRLRRLINQRLGYKNFTSFVNGYRLAEAMAALADASQAAVPILTIAMDAGFQSIGPFNRAFKAHTGLTPSAYRKQAESEIDQPI
ncbi:MAG TPA: helix-turn-helix domain-containing protein [Magnetospirillaceae bacterium]|jgi:AraC-like DNA-binding protein